MVSYDTLQLRVFQQSLIMACQQAFTPLRASVCRYLWAKWQGTPIILACDHPSMSRQTWRPSIPLSPSVEPSIHRMHTLNLNSCFLMTKLRFQRRSSDEAASFAFDQYWVLHKYLRNLYTRDIQMATSLTVQWYLRTTSVTRMLQEMLHTKYYNKGRKPQWGHPT